MDHLCEFQHICQYQGGVTLKCMELNQFGSSFSIQDQHCLFSFFYRPPSADTSFSERMDLMLTNVDCKNYRSCILGNFNIDPFSKSTLHKRFIALTKACGFHLLMSVSTRLVSGTLLDHVLVNCCDNVLESGTLSLTLSDHLPIYVSLKSRAVKLQSKGHKPILSL